nr:MAG TPA: hypothetical protein [Caudoviricetes sp.]
MSRGRERDGLIYITTILLEMRIRQDVFMTLKRKPLPVKIKGE